MWRFYALGALPALLSSGYLVFFFYRIITKILQYNMNIWLWLMIIILSLGLAYPAINFFHVWAVVFYYFIASTIILDIIVRFIPIEIMKTLVHTGIVSLIVVAIVIGYGYYNMNHVVQTNFNVKTKKLAQLNILQISDLHLDQSINPTQLEKYVKEMNKLDIDLVALTGDIFDEATPKKDMIKATQILGTLSNKLGIYYVYGNHDDQKYGNTMNNNTDHFNHQDIKEEMEKNHIIVLEDQVITKDYITIVGRQDASYQRKSAKELLAHVDKKNYIVVLDHQPLDMNENAKYGADLQLSGHTHGGQIWPTGTMQALVTRTMRYGVKTIDEFSIVTSSGIAGWGYPIKIGAPSEYAFIQVRHK